jgi:MoaA/NifB/PqqE/SkfB family radical SAM enzyme
MYKLEDIRDVHLELTSKCQARCPMCPRRINGGALNPLITLDEISLEQFKSWFPVEFIQQLDSLFMCGNLGDPIIAQDCLEIFQYIRTTNPTIRLSMHTNGSARNKLWWQALAETKVKVTFGIDGSLQITHSAYRIGTDLDKILENAQAFITAGGDARWDMLVFKHNEHQIDACKKLSQELGFTEFRTKHTSRFTEDSLTVLDDIGRPMHILFPTETSKAMISKVKEAQEDHLSTISCKAQATRTLYVSGTGNVSPCCWLDLEWYLPNHKSRIDYMSKIGEFPNLNNQTFKEIFDSNFFSKIQGCWTENGLRECSKQCGKFDKLGEQFVS